MHTKHSLLDNTVVALIFALGFAVLFRGWLFGGFDGVFGDEGDGQILLALVEHWNRVFAGQARWADPNFFYPQRGVLGLTDAYFLYGLPHAALRQLGFDPFTAFMLVMAALAAIGYFGFVHLAYQHFGIPRGWAAVGAFLFAFGNLNAVKLVHAQAYAAMLLPLVCDLALSAWARADRRGAVLGFAAGLLHALIFFTAYQTAWFFTFLIGLLVLLYPVVFGLAAVRELVREAWRRRLALIGYAAGFGIGIIPFLALYLPVLRAGFTRDFSEVISNAPRWLDIINLTPGNLVWGDVLTRLGITGEPNRPIWEVELGFTPGVILVFVAVCAVLVWRVRRSYSLNTRDRVMLLVASAAIVLWLLQQEYFGTKPWAVIWALVPGATAIRYIFRAQIVINLFFSLVVADALARFFTTPAARRGVLAIWIAVFLLVEQINVEAPVTISRRAKLGFIAAIPPAPLECRAFYLSPGASPADKQGFVHQADAMLFAAIRGMPTLNGFSSFLPPGWHLDEPGSPDYAASLRDWADRNNIGGLCGLDPGRGTWTVGLPRWSGRLRQSHNNRCSSARKSGAMSSRASA